MLDLVKRNLGATSALLIGLVVAALFRHPRLSPFIMLVALIAAGGIKLINWMMSTPRETKAELFSEAAIMAEESPLVTLTNLFTGFTDELSPILSSIFQTANRLLGYRPEDGVVGEIIRAYRGYIDEYLKASATLTKKYRRAKDYLSCTNGDLIQDEIDNLRAQVEAGNTELAKTLEGKVTTLSRLKAIEVAKGSILNSLQEIQATLQSMETTAIAAETSPQDMQSYLEEIQRTISTTGAALAQTFRLTEKSSAFRDAQ